MARGCTLEPQEEKQQREQQTERERERESATRCLETPTTRSFGARRTTFSEPSCFAGTPTQPLLELQSSDPVCYLRQNDKHDARNVVRFHRSPVPVRSPTSNSPGVPMQDDTRVNMYINVRENRQSRAHRKHRDPGRPAAYGSRSIDTQPSVPGESNRHQASQRFAQKLPPPQRRAQRAKRANSTECRHNTNGSRGRGCCDKGVGGPSTGFRRALDAFSLEGGTALTMLAAACPREENTRQTAPNTKETRNAANLRSNSKIKNTIKLCRRRNHGSVRLDSAEDKPRPVVPMPQTTKQA